jgi:hypothetical protein
MNNYFKAYDKDRTCQYLGEALDIQYFISNKGNFASHEGASYEAFFRGTDYKDSVAYVEDEAQDSGELFAWLDMTDYVSQLNGQNVFTTFNMAKLVKDFPLIDFLYVYDLAAGAYDFYVSEQGLHFTDAVGEAVLLPLDSNYDFYLDGLSVRFKV